MIVLNAGVPRSGTVLVNAILRKLLEVRGMRVEQQNPHGDALAALLRRLAKDGVPDKTAVLIHTHSWDQEAARLYTAAPKRIGFANYRDPRDVCVSLMRLHETELALTIEAVRRYFAAFEALSRDAAPVILPYELITGGIEATIFQIARRLSIWPTLTLVRRIAEETSPDRHRAIMEQVQDRSLPEIATRQNRHRTLAEDPATLINDRHIQSGRTGRWREELDPDAQARLQTAFAPLLKRYGFT